MVSQYCKGEDGIYRCRKCGKSLEPGHSLVCRKRTKGLTVGDVLENVSKRTKKKKIKTNPEVQREIQRFDRQIKASKAEDEHVAQALNDGFAILNMDDEDETEPKNRTTS